MLLELWIGHLGRKRERRNQGRSKNFTAKIDNPYLPFKPGTTLRYRGFEHGDNVDVFTVTHRVKKIMGVPNVVIRDRLFRGGKVREDTLDWYTQDREGTVWYFGELTKEVGADGRVVSTEGSWQAGVNGAKAGIFMPAHPQVGQSFKQESYKGHAEDRFRVESLTASVKVPYGSFDNVVKTTETSPLEPGVIDAKFYARGVGQVKEASVKGPRETSVLVSVKKPYAGSAAAAASIIQPEDAATDRRRRREAGACSSARTAA